MFNWHRGDFVVSTSRIINHNPARIMLVSTNSTHIWLEVNP